MTLKEYARAVEDVSPSGVQGSSTRQKRYYVYCREWKGPTVKNVCITILHYSLHPLLA